VLVAARVVATAGAASAEVVSAASCGTRDCADSREAPLTAAASQSPAVSERGLHDRKNMTENESE
jgi:hypothetical protein